MGKNTHRRGNDLNVLRVSATIDTDTILERSWQKVYLPDKDDSYNKKEKSTVKSVKKKKHDTTASKTLSARQRATKKETVVAAVIDQEISKVRKFKRLSGDTSLARKRALSAKSSDVGKRKSVKSVSRSSTMPGLASRGMTLREQGHLDGVRIVEQRTGKKIKETPAAKRIRIKKSGENMYKNSASVPDSLVDFANEIHTIERITPSEEIILGEKTQEAIRLQSLHDDLEVKLERQPTDEEWCAAAGKINLETLRQSLDEGLEAKNKLVTSNLRMVQGVVNIYIRNGLGAEYNAGDMMQEGILALIRAAEKFDPTRGFRFSTYAMYWIRSAVKRSQIIQSRVITVPQRLYENHKRIQRVEKELRGTLKRKPTKKEIGEQIGMSEVQVNRCLTAMAQQCLSLDQDLTNRNKPLTMTEKAKDSLIEIVDNKYENGEYMSQRRAFMREDLIRTLNLHLKPEEVRILLLRYGLMDEELLKADTPPKKTGPLTIAEVSSLVGYKPDKVRRMINKSLKQLRSIIGSEWLEYDRELQ